MTDSMQGHTNMKRVPWADAVIRAFRLTGCLTLFVLFLFLPPAAFADDTIGSVWILGGNSYGQHGNGTSDSNSHIDASKANVFGIKDLAAYTNNVAALRSDGTVWTWGSNDSGQLGQGTSGSGPYPTPAQANGLTGIVAVAGGELGSAALRYNGTVYTWGSNSYGRLGLGTADSNPHPTPALVPGLTGVIAIASSNHTLALKSDGTVWAWGYNGNGQLGLGTSDSSNHASPVQVPGLGSVVAIATGGVHSLALKSDGTVWAWGNNIWGQLGDNSTTNRFSPVQVKLSDGVTALTGVVAIACGWGHSLALKADGTTWTWGDNTYGTIGDGTLINRSTATQTSTSSHANTIAGGMSNSAAAISDPAATTSIMTWGGNNAGELGRTSFITTPGRAEDPVLATGVVAAGAGYEHIAALKSPWITSTLDSSASVGYYTSIATDALGKVHVSYYDNTNGNLKYVTNAMGSWITTTVDSAGIVGEYSSITVDSNYKAHISYYDRTNGNLKYATNATGSWVAETVDGNAWDTAGQTSIAIDSANKVHISYYDSTNFDLGYATNTSGSWLISWPDSTGDVGQYNSIAVDSSRYAHISYFDVTNTALKYVDNTTGSWGTPTTIDSTGTVGWYSSIAVDSRSKSHISYMDATNVDLKYATNSFGSWYAATIESNGSLGYYTSIAVDRVNRPHISYLDLTNYDLRYATRTSSGSWSFTTVDRPGSMGYYSSIAVDSSSNVHISYYGSGYLKYATNADTVAPTGSIAVNGGETYANTVAVSLSLSCSDGIGVGCAQMRFSNDGSNWSAAETFTTSKPWTLASGDGTRTVYVQFKDNVDNWSGSYTDTIILDTALPTGSIVINSGAAYTNSTLVTLSLSAGDTNQVTQMAISNDGVFDNETAEASAAARAWSLPAGDGSKTVYVRFMDSAGNWSATYTDSIILDTVPPTGTITINSGAATTNSTSVTLALYSADANQMQFSNDGSTWSAPQAYATARAWTLTSGDNAKTVYVRYMDSAGNWGTPVSSGIALDQTPPSAPTVTGATPTNNTTPTWSWSAGGGGNGTYRYRLDNPDLTTGTTTTTSLSYTPVSALGNGLHTLYVQERDAIGNWSVAGSYALTIDTTAPNAPMVIGSFLTGNSKPLWNWASGGNGGNGVYRARLDNSDLSTGTFTPAGTSHTPLTALGEGDHTLYVQERDDAGNWSLSGSYTTKVDTVAPDGSVSTASLTRIPAITLNISCSDGSGSGCSQMQFSNNGSSWSPWTNIAAAASWNLTDAAYGGTASDGSKTVYVQFKDSAGNISAPYSSAAVSLDTTPPAGTLLVNAGATYTTTTEVTLSISCNDGSGSGCSQMRFSNNGSSWSPAVPYAASYPWDLNNSSYGGTAADGGKTVYVQFLDSAGTWSNAIITGTIILDTAKPTGSLLINTGSAYATGRNVTLSLTCSDGSGSGCSLMRFSNNGSNWSPAAPYATSCPWDLNNVSYGGSLTDGSKIVYAQFMDNAGIWSTAAITGGIVLDGTAPVTSVSSPASVSNLTDATEVYLSCNDGSGIGCAGIWYTTDGSIPTGASAPYTGSPIRLSGLVSPVYLKFFSVDQMGNQEAPKTATVSFIAGFTTLTLDTPPTLLQNGLLDLSGKLTRYPDTPDVPNNGMDLSGLPVTLTVTGPVGSPCADGCIVTDTIDAQGLPHPIATYSSLGHYKVERINTFSYPGVYTISASFAGTGLHAPAISPTESILVGASAGYAVIVEGKVSTNEGLASHNKTTNRIYAILKERGFEDDNIIYFNYGFGMVPGVDGVPDKADIQYTIENWARGRMNGAPAPLYLIFVDHGNSNTFYIHPDTITSTELNSWITTMENGLNEAAKLQKRILILGACYSGSFLNELTLSPVPGINAGRITISSAAADEQSYKGPNEPDGIRSGEFFIEELFKSLKKGSSLRSAFIDASSQTRAFTSQGGNAANAVNSYNDTAVQHPLLDDNGDGVGSNSLVDTIGDGSESAAVYLGVGATNAALGPADIKSVTATRYLAATETETLLEADVYSNAAVSSAWIEVKAPTNVLEGVPFTTGQIDLVMPRWAMTLNGASWLAPYGSDPYRPLERFDIPGRYEIFYFTKSKNAEISEMRRSLVYKNYPGNAPPAPFSLITPADTSVVSTEFNMVWQPSSDPDGLTYTVQIATEGSSENSFISSIVFQKDELRTPWYRVESDAGLKDATSYFWRVVAIDSFGEQRGSQIAAFFTNNTNALPGRIRGYVYDNGSAAVTNATVTAKVGATVVAQTTSGTGGAFVFVVPPGNYSLAATGSGYLEGSSGSFTLSSGGTTDTSVTVTVSSPNLQIATGGSGSGTVSSNSGGISCSSGSPGSCSSAYANGATVTLTATPDWKSLFGGWSGAYSGGTNPLDVTMSYHKSLTAAFTPNLQARVGGSDYATLQGAYNAATEGATIKARVYTFQEHLLLDQDRTVTFDGGKDPAYDATTGATTVQGGITVSQGRMNVRGIAVK